MSAHSIRRQLTVAEKNNLGLSSDLVAQLLFHRGIADAEKAQRFLQPDYDRDTHDPFLLKDAEKAAERIIKAIQGKEKIAIYADYDADGIPGAAIWQDFFNRIGFAGFTIYIPHRHNEGFGVNSDAIRELAVSGVRLIVTLDCGITDVGPISLAKELGIEVIVTDHHEPPPGLPPAFAIVDHKQADCAYPEKNICGSGVAFKLIQAILKLERFGLKEGQEKWLLDLVGMATLSDMVPLVGENRVFAHYGLTVLRKSQRKGLSRLLARLKIVQRHVTEDDIAFMITPRINAASRMGAPRDAFNLLVAADDVSADACAKHLDEINDQRKIMVSSLVKEVKRTIKERYGEKPQATDGTLQSTIFPHVIVLGNPEWRPSLLGLAANSCAEEFDRPVFLWGRDGDNLIKGSCRSEGSTHVVELMRAVPVGIFSQFGGHRHSGGFAVSNESVYFLEQRLNEVAKKIQEVGSRKQEAGDWVDAELSLDAVDYHLHDEIDQLAPFGMGNPKPIFIFKSVAPDSVRTFGKSNDHVELTFKKSNGTKIPAISFFGVANEWAKSIQVGKPIDLIASIEKSMFRGRPQLRLRIVDIL